MPNPLVIAGCLALGLGGVAFIALAGQSRSEKRRAAVAGAGRRIKESSDQAEKTARRKQIADGLRELEKKNRRRLGLEARLEQAGLKISRRQFIVMSAVCGLLVGVITNFEAHSPLLALFVAVMAAGGAPRFLLARLRKRRIHRFIENFPNAIDIIVRGVKAGLPLGDTIRIAANESVEPVRSEFRKIVESLSLGLTLPEAVERMAQRVPITETNFFSIVIAIQGKAGGNLSEAVGNLSRVLRERKKMKGKIAAMAMEAKASAVIIGAVPFLVVGALYLSSPKYVSLLWTTSHGHIIAGAALIWMSIGVAMMKKMISFDF